MMMIAKCFPRPGTGIMLQRTFALAKAKNKAKTHMTLQERAKDSQWTILRGDIVRQPHNFRYK